MKKNYTRKLHFLFAILSFGFLFVQKTYAQPPQFNIGSYSGNPKTTITIPVTAQNFIQVLGIQGSINWDNSKITYNSTNGLNTSLSGLSFNASVSGSTGRLSYVWTDNSLNPQTIANGGVLFNIVFNLLPNTTGTTTIAFSNTPTPLLVSDNNVQPINGITYNAGSITVPWSLPIGLFNFSANIASSSVNLKWSSSFEKNTDYFDIEKSTDGANFIAVSSLNASGNSTLVKQYSFTDKLQPEQLNKTIYYRIKTVDKDGHTSYSNIINVKASSKASVINVYPNPATNNLNLQINHPIAEEAQLTIINFEGKTVTTTPLALFAGNTSSSININQLTSGNYLLKITTKTTEITTRFTKN